MATDEVSNKDISDSLRWASDRYYAVRAEGAEENARQYDSLTKTALDAGRTGDARYYAGKAAENRAHAEIDRAEAQNILDDARKWADKADKDE